MVQNCAAVGCKTLSIQGIPMFRIPAVINENNKKFKFPKFDHNNRCIQDVQYVAKLSKERQLAWVKVLKRGPLSNSQLKNFRVCARHFISGNPSELLDKDDPDWIPNQFLGYEVRATSLIESSIQRNIRAKNRDKAKRDKDELTDEDSTLLHECNNQFAVNENSSNGDECMSENLLPDPATKNNPEPMLEPKFKDAETQTDLTMEELGEILAKLQIHAESLKKLQESIAVMQLYPESFVDNDSKTLYFTGLPNHEFLFAIHNIIAPIYYDKRSKLTTFQQLILTLMKLRLNLPNEYLSYRFNITSATVNKYFRRVIHIIYNKFKNLVHWPEPSVLHSTMPACFKQAFGERISGILDCFEIKIESPPNLDSSAECWSSYKHHKTAKVLLYIVPQGSISFISEAWGGRTSDKYLTEHCGFFEKVRPGDCIMADRGFTINNELKTIGATAEIPAFTKGKKQLDPVEIESTRSIANVRIHVERVIGSLRQKFNILSGVLPICMLKVDEDDVSILDEILVVCSVVVNLCPALISLE